MKLKKNICEDCCKGKRISELDEKVDIQGTEYIPFQEGNDNGKFSLGSLKDYLTKLIEEYLINNGIIREDWVQSEPAYKLLATLPELIADRACKDEFGNNINDTYLTREAVKEYIGTIYEDLFVNNPPQILDGFITVDMLSDAVLQLLNSGGAITNFPDDEDITVKDGKLKFKDKVYDPNNYSGMGRTILRKNTVDGVNVLTQEMMSEPNVIYVIQYDYDLRGETIVVPDNSILWYLGGSLNNGHITSDDEDRLIIWGNLNGDVEIDIDVSLVGAPADEEDITTESGVLKFKDKEYDTASFSGLGRKYLRKNIVKGKNILTQEMINSANTRYIIQYDYDLNEETITVPEGCVLQFDGGSLSNGTINGNNTIISANLVEVFATSMNFSGNWNIDSIFPEWFGAKGDDLNDDSNAIQAAINFSNITKSTVSLLPKIYKVTKTINIYNNNSIKGSINQIGYWVTKSIIKEYSNVPIINLKSQTTKEVITGLSLYGFTLTYDNSVVIDENCVGINISDDFKTVKGLLFKNLFVYKCWYGFKFEAFDNIQRGYSLNSWEGCYFSRNIVGAYFYGNGVGSTWMNLNSFKDCGFQESKQKGVSIRSFNSLQENEFYSCSFETNGYNNEDGFDGIGIEIQSNGGITTLDNCYLENNISKKLIDTYSTYDKSNEDFLNSCNVKVIGGAICVRNSIIANSPNFIHFGYSGSSAIVENNQYINSIGNLFCGKILTISNISIGNSFLTGIRIKETIPNQIKGVFNFIENADIRDANINVDVNLSNHSKLLLKYNSLRYYEYDYLILDSSSTGDGILGIETDNGFRSIGQLLRNVQRFADNEIRVKFNSDITERVYVSSIQDKNIIIEGNSKTWTIDDSAIDSSVMFTWDNCNVVINDLNIVFTNTKTSLIFINSIFNSNIVFNNCNFTINTNQNVEFLRGFNKTFNNCTFTGEVTGNFYLNDNFNLKLINTEYPFRIYYPYKGDTSRVPNLSSNDQGQRYFDTTLINSEYWDGVQWRNEDGTLTQKVTII